MKTRQIVGALAAIGALTLGSVAAPANAVPTNTCRPSVTLDMSSTTRVASGYADCLIPKGMKVSVTIALYADGYEAKSSYRSFTTTSISHRFHGYSVSYYLSSRNICAKTFVSWQLPDGYGGLKWMNDKITYCH